MKLLRHLAAPLFILISAHTPSQAITWGQDDGTKHPGVGALVDAGTGAPRAASDGARDRAGTGRAGQPDVGD